MMDLVTHYFKCLGINCLIIKKKQRGQKGVNLIYVRKMNIYEQMFSSEVFCLFSSCAVMVKRPFGALIVLKIRSQ